MYGVFSLSDEDILEYFEEFRYIFWSTLKSSDIFWSILRSLGIFRSTSRSLWYILDHLEFMVYYGVLWGSWYFLELWAHGIFWSTVRSSGIFWSTLRSSLYILEYFEEFMVYSGVLWEVEVEFSLFIIY